MSLYQKYRPQSFDDMLGSKETIATLKDAIANPNRSHAYLFTGPSGCGKTTAARIFAHELGVDEMALLEINSANNRGIDSARSIIEQMRSYPFKGNCWVWIIDEAHMTSKDFQNAMLKPLEDTPAHVYFFICTTNPEKLIKPVKTRCTEVKFSAFDSKYLSVLLRRVSKAEGIELDSDVLEEIIDDSDGSARKALVDLENVAKLDKEQAIKLLHSSRIVEDGEDESVLGLCQALIRKDGTWGDVCEHLKEVYSSHSDFESIRYQILGYANSVLLKGKENNRAALIIECFSEPFYDSGKAGVTLSAYQSMLK